MATSLPFSALAFLSAASVPWESSKAHLNVRSDSDKRHFCELSLRMPNTSRSRSASFKYPPNSPLVERDDAAEQGSPQWTLPRLDPCGGSVIFPR